MPLQKVLLDVHGDALPSYTFTRSSSGYQIDADGVLRLKSTDLLRIDYLDLDNDGERETPSIVVECASTNKFTRSIEFSNAAWTKVNSTADANVGAAPDLSTQADLLLPTTASGLHYVGQSVSVTASTDHAMSVYCAPAGYNFLSLRIENSSGNYAAEALFALTSSGSVADSTTLGSGVHRRSHIERIRPGVYRATLVASISTSTTASCRIGVAQTSSQIAASWAGAGTSGGLGIMLWGAQLEEAMPAETSLMQSSAASLGRAAETVYVPFPYTPRPMSLYVKFIERCGFALTGTVVFIGSAASGDARLFIQSNGSVYRGIHDNGTASISTLAAAPSYGDTVELLLTVGVDGTPILYQSINGATATTGTGQTAQPFAGAWSDTRLYLGTEGGTGNGMMNRLLDVKVMEGVQDMATMRSLAPFWVVDGVAIPVAVDSVREERLEIGDRDRTFDGSLRETIRSRVGIWSGETQPLSMTDRVRALDALESSTQPIQTYGNMCRTSTGKLPTVNTRVTNEALIQSSTERRYVLSFTAEQSS